MGSLGLNWICYRTARLDFTLLMRTSVFALDSGQVVRAGRSQIEIIDSNGQTTWKVSIQKK